MKLNEGTRFTSPDLPPLILYSNVPGISFACSAQRTPMESSSSVSRVNVAFFLQDFSLQMSGLTGLVCGCPNKSPQLIPKALVSTAVLDVCSMSSSHGIPSVCVLQKMIQRLTVGLVLWLPCLALYVEHIWRVERPQA